MRTPKILVMTLAILCSIHSLLSSEKAWGGPRPDVWTAVEFHSSQSRTWILQEADAEKIFNSLPQGERECGSRYGEGDYSCWVTKEVEGLWCRKILGDNTISCRIDGKFSALPISYDFHDSSIKELVAVLSGGTGRWVTSDGRLAFDCNHTACRATPLYLDSVWVEKGYMPLSDGYVSGEFAGEEAKRVYAALSVKPRGETKKVGNQWNAFLEATPKAGTFAFSLVEGHSLENSVHPKITGTLEKEISNALFDALSPTANGRILKVADRSGFLEFTFDCSNRAQCSVTAVWKKAARP